MLTAEQFDPPRAWRHLSANTVAFTVCFAVWTIFSVIGVRIQQDLGLSETEFGILVATPILTGSVSRLFLGIWTEQFGGRLVFTLVMLVTAACTYLLSFVETYALFLLAALGLGLAGGSFSVGVSYTSKWFDSDRQGTALGVFGVGNLGAAVTNFGAPLLLVAVGWEQTAVIYAAVLTAMAVIFWLITTEDPVTRERKATGAATASLRAQLEPLKRVQVWRFGLYYFFVFGGFVALASWLPRYYVGAYDLDLTTAGMLAAAYSTPAALFRALGGYLSDRFGARAVMYAVLSSSLFFLFLLSYPSTTYLVHGMDGPIEFTIAPSLAERCVVLFLLGFAMSLGMAAVYKHIPVYYPAQVGSVGGLVGMIGGLGGFFMPIAFGALNDLTGVWTTPYMLLFALVGISLVWMHFAIRRMEVRRLPELATEQRFRYLPELQPDYKREGK